MRTNYSQAIVACVYDRQGIAAHIVHHDGPPSRKRQQTIENQDGYGPMVVHSIILICRTPPGSATLNRLLFLGHEK